MSRSLTLTDLEDWFDATLQLLRLNLQKHYITLYYYSIEDI